MEQHTRETLEFYAESLRNKIKNKTRSRQSLQIQVDEHSSQIHDTEANLRQVEADLNG